MKILDQEQTRAALPYAELIDALDQGFCGAYEAPLRHHHYLENAGEEDDVLLLMPAWRAEGFGRERPEGKSSTRTLRTCSLADVLTCRHALLPTCSPTYVLTCR